jgi:hypothetical protein
MQGTYVVKGTGTVQQSHGNPMSSKQEVSHRMNVGEDDKSDRSDLQVDTDFIQNEAPMTTKMVRKLTPTKI